MKFNIRARTITLIFPLLFLFSYQSANAASILYFWATFRSNLWTQSEWKTCAKTIVFLPLCALSTDKESLGVNWDKTEENLLKQGYSSEDAIAISSGLNYLVKIDINQTQFDALVAATSNKSFQTSILAIAPEIGQQTLNYLLEERGTIDDM